MPEDAPPAGPPPTGPDPDRAAPLEVSPDEVVPAGGRAGGFWAERVPDTATGAGARDGSDRTVTILVIAGAVVLWLAIRSGTIGMSTLVRFGVLIPAIILHEVSHGAVALLFGDPTAKEARRLSLNPIRHIDPFGTILLPAMLILTTGSGFGYAKPVPVNPRRMRSPRNHGLLVSLAGPATNIVLALLTAVAIRATFTPLVYDQFRGGIFGEPPLWAQALLFFGFLNVVLAVFNLIPIPPLDGSAVIERVLPYKYWPAYLRFRQYSMGLLLVLILVVPGDPLSRLFDPAIELWLTLLH